MDDEREKKIQEAIANNLSKWDEKYSQKDWKGKVPKSNKVTAKRVKGGIAAKAIKNIW